MLEKKKLEKLTRKIFHDIHTDQIKHPHIVKRMKDLLNTEYLKLSKNYFQGKICLDVGCGSMGSATHSMLRNGAKKVYAIDLDNTFFDSVTKNLKEFEGKYELSIGNVLNLDYNDKKFDFTHCAGVLHHTGDVFKSYSELARVTKVGGIVYTMTYGKGGLIREITSFLRKKYQKDTEFKSLIDNLTEESFSELFDWMASTMDSHDNNMKKLILSKRFRKNFDSDWILTLKDRITAPIYDEHSEEEIVTWLKNNGFSKIERLTRYPKFKNVRRLLSPFYYRYESKYSRLLYGSGVIQLKAVKIK